MIQPVQRSRHVPQYWAPFNLRLHTTVSPLHQGLGRLPAFPNVQFPHPASVNGVRELQLLRALPLVLQHDLTLSRGSKQALASVHLMVAAVLRLARLVLWDSEVRCAADDDVVCKLIAPLRAQWRRAMGDGASQPAWLKRLGGWVWPDSFMSFCADVHDASVDVWLAYRQALLSADLPVSTPLKMHNATHLAASMLFLGSAMGFSTDGFEAVHKHYVSGLWMAIGNTSNASLRSARLLRHKVAAHRQLLHSATAAAAKQSKHVPRLGCGCRVVNVGRARPYATVAVSALAAAHIVPSLLRFHRRVMGRETTEALAAHCLQGSSVLDSAITCSDGVHAARQLGGLLPLPSPLDLSATPWTKHATTRARVCVGVPLWDCNGEVV